MSHCLAGALDRYQASTAVISGLLETLSADGLTADEVDRMADRMIESVRHLTLHGFSLLCPCPFVPMPVAPAHRLFTTLRSISRHCIQVYEEQGKFLTEEISVDAIPHSEDPCEAVGTGHPFHSCRQYAAVQSRPVRHSRQREIAGTTVTSRLRKNSVDANNMAG